ncbi:MAG TPA: phosphomannomutase/phosphoglucomutase, partial [Candidatus Pacearchaeota archaeon]|nr:phosphomannomutase/phosphoglucomutase [Candidatus Pacearchaeota archaeon]
VALKETILKERADLGVAFDGDGDRIVFFDEQGNFISPDLTLALMASLILKDSPGAKIVYDVCSSNIVKETAESLGGKAIMSKVGHSFVCEKIKKESAVFGAEYSGHFFLKDPYTIESPFFVLFNVLGTLKKEGRPLSEIVLPFRKYFHSGQINLKVNNKEEKIKKLEEKYQGQGRVVKIDGLRIDFDDWWFLVRPSNTEPVIRLMVEAKIKNVMKDKVKELQSFLLQ